MTNLRLSFTVCFAFGDPMLMNDVGREVRWKLSKTHLQCAVVMVVVVVVVVIIVMHLSQPTQICESVSVATASSVRAHDLSISALLPVRSETVHLL